MTASLNNLLGFVAFTHDIRSVKRAMWVKGEGQFENDSEHSYQLAMVVLYIAENDRQQIDVYKAMGLALVHDIVEVHAGDTPTFGSNADTLTQVEREPKAITTLRAQWPKLSLMHALIEEYETKSSPEAKLVYALDKLVPVLNNYLDNGRNWKKGHISLDQVIKVKVGKVDVDPIVKRYFEEMLAVLKKKPELFG